MTAVCAGRGEHRDFPKQTVVAGDALAQHGNFEGVYVDNTVAGPRAHTPAGLYHTSPRNDYLVCQSYT